MGIPKFYRDWLARHNFNGVLLGQPPSSVSSLSIDVNGVIHKAAAQTWGYDEKSTPELRKLLANVNPYELKAKFEYTFSTMLQTIVTSFSPRDVLIIAVDGVAPVAKIQQQRQRRYKAAANRGPTDLFDTNSITPGTDFMISLDNYIERWIISNRLVLPPTVIYSSYKVPGEGEHKIMDLWRQGKVTGEGAHMLYGLDADLIMLSLLAPINRVFLSREDDNDIVSIDNLRDVLRTYMASQTAIDDFVVMMYLIGNDFLPHGPALGRMSRAIDVMTDVYRTVGKPLTGDGQILISNLGLFLVELAKQEPALLTDYAPHLLGKEERHGTFLYPSKIMAASIDGNNFNFDTYRELWYRNALLPRGDPSLFALLGIPEPQLSVDMIEEMCRAYMTGLSWTYVYYQSGMSGINTLYYYPYYHAPLLLDLSFVISQATSVGNYPASSNEVKYNALHQLLAVLPPLSADLLPIEIQPLATPNSPLADLFPETFSLEVDGLKDAKMGLAILPFADMSRIIDVMSAVRILPKRMEFWAIAENKESVQTSQLSGDIQRLQATLATVERASRRPVTQKKQQRPKKSNIPTKPSIPAKQISIPIKQGTVPTLPTLPIKQGIAPTVPTLPIKQGTVPTLPIKQGIAPTVPTLPIKQGTVPTLPIKQGTVPTLPTLPIKQGIAPTVPTLPIKQGTVPTLPIKQGTVPTLPIKQGTVPTIPIKQVSVPVAQPLVPSIPVIQRSVQAWGAKSNLM